MAVEALEVPGEIFIPSKPWLRKVGNQVVRYVRPAVENPGVGLVRTLPNALIALEDMLCAEQDRFEAELESLERDYSVTIPATEVAIDEAPFYDALGQQIGRGLGMVVSSDFVNGQAISPKMIIDDPEHYLTAVNAQHEGLTDYLADRRRAEEVFLGDIFHSHQHLYSAEYVGLPMIDTDPLFAAGTPQNYAKAAEHLSIAYDEMASLAFAIT